MSWSQLYICSVGFGSKFDCVKSCHNSYLLRFILHHQILTSINPQLPFPFTKKGWTFDGENGECTEIPQTLIAQQKNNKLSSSSSNQSSTKKSATATGDEKTPPPSQSASSRACYGFIHPARPSRCSRQWKRGSCSPPPRVPETDVEGYRSTPVVRDY